MVIRGLVARGVLAPVTRESGPQEGAKMLLRPSVARRHSRVPLALKH